MFSMDSTNVPAMCTLTISKGTSNASLVALHEITTALTNTHHLVQVARVLNDRGMALFHADAGCVFVRRADGRLEMLAERGCTARFKSEWRIIPAGCLALAVDGLGDQIFLGSGADFKGDTPTASDLVDHSGRQLIGYAPLTAGGRVLGVFGFSFDKKPIAKPSPELARAFAAVAGLALMRFQDNSSAGDGPLSLVPHTP